MDFTFWRSASSANDAQALEANERETRWLREIAAGGPAATAALDRLVDAYEGRMLSFCLRERLSQADAEDVMQELWIRIHRGASSFRGDVAPSSWIWRLLRNLIADTYRDRWNTRRVNPAPQRDGDDDDGQGLLEVAVTESEESRRWSADECVRQKLQLVGKLFPDEAAAMDLRHLHDWGIPELAAHIERTETATRSFLRSVRIKFRPYFQPCLDLLIA